MRLIFCWQRYVPPFFIGGAEISQQLLATGLASRGCIVKYIGSHQAPWDAESLILEHLSKLSAESQVQLDAENARLLFNFRGVDCVEVARSDVLHELGRTLMPGDLVITAMENSASIVHLCRSRGVRVILWLHSINRAGSEALRAKPDHWLATSKFVLDEFREQAPPTSKATIYYPPFEPIACNPQATFFDVVMVNPIEPKGLSVFRGLAETFPELQFLAVEGWWNNSSALEHLGNVAYQPQSEGLAEVYAHSAVIVVPSITGEGFGRVAVEAALSGCVPLVSAFGGLIEAVPDPQFHVRAGELTEWIRALRSIREVSNLHSLRRKAQKSAGRFVDDYVDRFLSAID